MCICIKMCAKNTLLTKILSCTIFFSSLLVQNVLTVFLSLLYHTTLLSICCLSDLPPSCSLLCLLALVPFSFCSFLFLLHSLVLTSTLSPCPFLPPSSDIQTLPRVYFFDSYATLQANGSDSRFFSSSVCHTHIPHSHLCWHHCFVFCLPSFWLPRAFLCHFWVLFSWYLCRSVVNCCILLILLSCYSSLFALFT